MATMAWGIETDSSIYCCSVFSFSVCDLPSFSFLRVVAINQVPNEAQLLCSLGRRYHWLSPMSMRDRIISTREQYPCLSHDEYPNRILSSTAFWEVFDTALPIDRIVLIKPFLKKVLNSFRLDWLCSPILASHVSRLIRTGIGVQMKFACKICRCRIRTRNHRRLLAGKFNSSPDSASLNRNMSQNVL